jgi:hypothetical protein
MAVVFLGHDRLLSRQVAIKVLLPAVGDALSSERFKQEIEITARLEHPRIIPVQDRGDAGGVLYYVMRRCGDGSLRDLLRTTGQLTVQRAVAIAADVAQALDHAHKHGVVHRDVKPENILLEGGSAYVCDFGVARLIDAADRQKLTRTGIVIGTPQYMSPEQADGKASVDGRSDVYSLACVTYEMLAGEPPYGGRTHRDVLAKHLAAPVPDLTIVRDTVTPAMQRVMETALRKSPADRYATAGEFVAALAAATVAKRDRWWAVPAQRRKAMVRAGIGVAAGGLILAAAAALPTTTRGRALAAIGLGDRADTARLTIAAFTYDSTTGVRFPERELLGDAMARWRGITVVDDQNGGESPRPGRIVRGQVSRVQDFIRIHASVYDTDSDSLVRQGTVRVSAATLGGLEAAFAELAERLLFSVSDSTTRGKCRKTRVPRAFEACGRAAQEIAAWRLPQADSALVSATDTAADADFAYAHLQLAQVRSWRQQPVARWASSAARAAAGRSHLDAGDQVRSDALLAFARDSVGRACEIWEAIVGRAPSSHEAWYSLAVCLRADVAVVPDRTSPSQWRFRSSYHRSLHAFRRAFELRPAILEGFKDRIFAGVRQMFVTAPSVLRAGVSADGRRFFARAAWSGGDSLIMVPFPEAAVTNASPETRLRSTNEAITHQRRMFGEIATAWVASDPASASAMEALATALEMQHDPGARDTLRRARSLAQTADERLRIAAHEVWLEMRFALPDDARRMRAARALADSLLRAANDVTDPRPLVALAVVTGRAAMAGALTRRGATLVRGSNAGTTTRGLLLLSFASLGGPTDTLRALESQLASAIARLPEVEQGPLRAGWLDRAATLTFPDVSMGPRPGIQDSLLRAQLAVLAGDTLRARKYLDDKRRARAGSDLAAISLDGAYPEAALLDRMGDARGAAAWLDPLLRALPEMTPDAIGDVAAAGSLVRAMALRADLAARAGDQPTARRWAAAVVTLWSDADPFLQSTVQRMRVLAR